MAFRNGQWVTTATAFPGAHTTADGRTVGVFQAARRLRTPGIDGTPEVIVELPDRVHIVKTDRTDLMELDGDKAVSVVRTLGQLEDVRPLIEADDIPGRHALEDTPGAKLEP